MAISFIFDMDGLILDTENIARIIWPKCYNFISKEEADKDYLSIVGKSNPAIVSFLEHKYPNQPIAKINNQVDKEIVKYVKENGVSVKPGVIELLDYLDKHHIKKAIATSSQLAVAKILLKKANLYDRFEHIICGNHIKKSKPDPEIFLYAANLMQTNPKFCFVCEDSYNGIRAAFAAGMIPIMIPDQIPPDNEMKEKAFRIYDRIDEIIDELDIIL